MENELDLITENTDRRDIVQEAPSVIAGFEGEKGDVSVEEMKEILRADAKNNVSRARGNRVLALVADVFILYSIYLICKSVKAMIWVGWDYEWFTFDTEYRTWIIKMAVYILILAGCLAIFVRARYRLSRKGQARLNLKRIQKENPSLKIVHIFYDTHIEIIAGGLRNRIEYGSIFKLYRSDNTLSFVIKEIPRMSLYAIRRKLTEGDFESLVGFLEEKTGCKAERI